MLAPRRGLEPLTNGLEGRRSIHLSYRGKAAGDLQPPEPADKMALSEPVASPMLRSMPRSGCPAAEDQLTTVVARPKRLRESRRLPDPALEIIGM